MTTQGEVRLIKWLHLAAVILAAGFLAAAIYFGKYGPAAALTMAMAYFWMNWRRS